MTSGFSLKHISVRFNLVNFQGVTNTSRELVKWSYTGSTPGANRSCPQLIKDENDIDVQYSKNLVPPGHKGTVSDKIQGL
jgi:hypothetical protein